MTVTKDGSYTINGDTGRTTNVKNDDNLTVGKKITISAKEDISISNDKASIVMTKEGNIQIKGVDILIEASGKITAKADGDMVLKGSKIGHN